MPTNIKVICSHAHQWHVDLHQDRCTGREGGRGKRELLLSVLPSMEANQQFSHLFFVNRRREEGEKKLTEFFAVGVCRTECSVGREPDSPAPRPQRHSPHTRILPAPPFPSLSFPFLLPARHNLMLRLCFKPHIFCCSSIIRYKVGGRGTEPVACRQIGLIDFKSFLCFHFDLRSEERARE